MDYQPENGDQQFAEDPSHANFEQTETEAPEATEAGAGDSQGRQINASKNDDDERYRKIFVGGLSWETTVKDMKDYFCKFGDVLDCTLKTDPTTGRSRGFGFVLYGSSQDVDKVIDHGTHVLDGRTIDPKRANPRGGKEPLKKLFVGGLDPDTPEDDIRKHFGQFGKIEEIDLPYDKMKGQRRAFCFITFESEANVDKCCENPRQSLGSKEVDVKKATPKDQRGGFDFRGGRGGAWGPPRGGRGAARGNGRGGRGGYNQDWNNQGGYDYNNYYNQGYGTGYDYNQGYGQGYTGYDYNNYYNQGWGNYNQGYGSGYGNTGYGNNSYGGYDYSSWYGQDPGQQTGGTQVAQNSTFGKAKRGATTSSPPATASGSYHPYTR